MARTLGEAGKFVSDEADKKHRQMLVTGFVVFGLMCWVWGFLVGFAFHKKLWWVSLLVSTVALLAILGLRWWLYRHVDQLAKERKDYLRGASGEMSVGYKLTDFPDGFYIINGLKTQAGDVDHIVVGPTGVFALDTKSWRGVVSADGKGELLVNGVFEQPHITQFLRRVMGIRDRVKALAPEIDFFIKSVFVFTSARVEANWRDTGYVHCIRDDQLFE